jgi:hypothetical protein
MGERGNLAFHYRHTALPTFALPIAVGGQPDASLSGGFQQVSSRRNDAGYSMGLKAYQ